MRLFKRLILALCIIFIISLIGGYLYVYNHYVVPILTYHSINYVDIGTPAVKPENFEKQIRCLKDRNYNIISLNELAVGIIENKKFPRNTVVITFDDGFKDNYAYAYPILKKYKIPATIFLISDFIGKKNEHLSWEQVSEMLSNNITFGSHTRTHSYLPDVNRDIAWEEISGSKKQIEEKIGKKILYFSYPAGGFNKEIKNQVKLAGYKAACTTNRGFDKSNRDVYELNRIKITDKDANMLKFHAKLSGYYNIFRSQKNPS